MLTQDFRQVLGHAKPIPAIPATDEATLSAFLDVTGDEPYFVGHFPGFPVVPGVLLVEAMAQTALSLAAGRFGPDLDAHLVGVEKARFSKLVQPPARLRFLACALPEPASPHLVRCACVAFVGEARVARADLLLSFQPWF